MAKRVKKEGGGHATQYPGKDPRPLSVKLTPRGHAKLRQERRARGGWSASDVFEGKLHGDI